MVVRPHRAFLVVVGLLFVAGLVACATTRLDAQWSNPAVSADRIGGKWLVVGMTRDATVRRLYEDEMAAQLAARGVDAVRSYEVIDGPLAAEGAALASAARSAGAAVLLTSALVAREQVQRVIVEPLPTWGWGYEGWYGHYWSLAMTRTETRSYERYVVGTSLTDVASGRIVWTARTVTENDAAVAREVRAFARLIAGALEKAGRV